MTYEETQRIKHLREVTSVMVEKSSNGIECTKIDLETELWMAAKM